jgi:hypothetical protein
VLMEQTGDKDGVSLNTPVSRLFGTRDLIPVDYVIFLFSFSPFFSSISRRSDVNDLLRGGMYFNGEPESSWALSLLL